MMNYFRRFLRHMAFRHRRCHWLYMRLCRPGSTKFAAYLKRQGRLYSIGDMCAINTGANITDPAYVRIGNNCSLSACTLLGHDAVVRILNNVHGTKIDAVGKIDIRDNCFIEHGAIVMPNTTIGPDSVVAAGAVVTKDVPPGVMVGGVPAKIIGTTDELMERQQKRSNTYPWISLIESREGPFDPALEPELVRQRVRYFYGDT